MTKVMIVLMIAFVVIVSVSAFAEVHVGLTQMIVDSGFMGPMYNHMNSTESIPHVHDSCGDFSTHMNTTYHIGHMH